MKRYEHGAHQDDGISSFEGGYARREFSENEFGSDYPSQQSYVGSELSTSSQFINFDMFLDILKRKELVPSLLPISRVKTVFQETAQEHEMSNGRRTQVIVEDQVVSR
jgi:hypothetical protein